MPPLAELLAFEAAARHLSFKAAADEIGVTPTAISHQIKLLEQYCGQPLFRRRPRPLALTWAGEELFPALRDGFLGFAEALTTVRSGGSGGRLRVTATNAFAGHWLVPRLPKWRAAHPRLKLGITGTDLVQDLKAGEADIAIRYARKPPADGPFVALASDTFHVVGSPMLVNERHRMLSPAELAAYPLIEAEWPPADAAAPNWRQWRSAALERHKSVPDLAAMVTLSFREELLALQAALAGQGIAICSDVLIASELRNRTLLRLSDVTLPGYTYFIVHRKGHPKIASIQAFIAWAKSEI